MASVIKLFKGKYPAREDMKRVFNYDLKSDDDGNTVWDGLGVITYSPQTAMYSMIKIKELYDKEDGRQIFHMMVSVEYYKYCSSKEDFELYEQMKEQYRRMIAGYVCSIIYNEGYQNCYYLHSDTEHFHYHFIINSINYNDGTRLSKIKGLLNKILYQLRSMYPELNFTNVVYED